jgi:zinc transport system substrate-binding protein
MIMKKYLSFAILMFAFNLPLSAAQYLASITPIYSLAQGLLTDVAEVDLLLDGQTSAHTYSLKQSDIQKIQAARIVLWLGPTYESFLSKPLESFKKQTYSLLEGEGLTRYPLRDGEEWQCNVTHPCGCGHAEEHSDPHIWLDPANALVIIEALKSFFIDQHPDKRSIIEENYERVKGSLIQLQLTLQARLTPVKDQAFLVFHDGYQYFEKAFSLNGVGVMVINPENSPSVKHMRALIADTKAKGVKCIFSETQFNPALIQAFARHQHLRIGTLDPLGTPKHHSEQDYVEMMMQLADNFVNCFK